MTMRRAPSALRTARPWRLAWAAVLAVAATPSLAVDGDALLREGRALYRGERAWSRAAQLHGVALAGAACVQCHGPHGEARTEAGVPVPAITWQRLAQPAARRPAYANEAAVLRALESGHDPAGRALAAPMPRYYLDAHEARALLAWLRAMGTEAAPVPGVTADRVALGAVLPLSGPQAAAGRAVREALERGIESINRSGGLFGRRLTLEVADAGPDAASASAAATQLVRSERAFVLVASLVPAPGAPLRQALVAHDSALVAALGQPVQPEEDARITWLLPSLAQQAAALAAALPKHCASARDGLRVLYWRQGAVAALASDAPLVTWQPIDGPADLQQALAAAPARATVALLPPALAQQARDAQGGTGQCLGTLAVVSGAPPADSRVPELLGLPMPPTAVPAGGAALWSLLADSSLAVAVEALSRTGRQLDVARFLAAVDSLQRLPVASAPGLTLAFGPHRRHGFEPAWIWKEGTPHDHSTPSPIARR
ncbi:MAG: ABC transporter substrate-binding protein [Acidovorax sp.]